TENARKALKAGVEALRRGGSAVDAVEAAIRVVEENPLDHGVGLGGIPNLLGVVQLDASIMEGRTLRAGAVAAVREFLHPISIARRVMEESPHVLLVGEGAELFAEAVGFKRHGDLLTDRTREMYRAFLEDALEGLDESFTWREYIVRYVENYRLRDWYERLMRYHGGTVDVLAMDANGDVCSGVSTSGTALKLPGRVGDSPIIGAGNYCDNRVGAAACTGRGELAIRLSTARSIIEYMRNGRSVEEACIQAMEDVLRLGETGGLNCVAFDMEGNTAAASTYAERLYYYMDVEMEEPEGRRGVLVKG
ncbi:MAG: isoaspartyl peptidase, partial [Candidatus Bathyarchaeota archaeon B23]